jgi:cytochrome b561
VIVSASPLNIPTLIWDVIPLPHLPGFEDMSRAEREDVVERVGAAHSALAWFAIGLLVLHVAGALKHHFLEKDTVLWRMLPLVGRPRARS